MPAAAALSLLPGTDQVVSPPAQLSGKVASALAWQAGAELLDDWGTDVLSLADPRWEGKGRPLTSALNRMS
jgi:hypothetical protein